MILNSCFVKVKKSVKKRGPLGFLKASLSYVVSLAVLYLGNVSNVISFFVFLSFHRHDFFIFKDRKIDFLIHPYNRTWENERSLEVPIIWNRILDSHGKESRILELGNVLSHYKYFAHDVIDKYEKGRNVLNVDIVDFSSDALYDFIFTISTIEHVGYDCGELPDSEKPKRAIEKLLSMLKKGGQLIVTFPIGYNPFLDDFVFRNRIYFSEIYFYHQYKDNLNWELITKDEVESFKGAKNSKILCILITHK